MLVHVEQLDKDELPGTLTNRPAGHDRNVELLRPLDNNGLDHRLLSTSD